MKLFKRFFIYSIFALFYTANISAQTWNCGAQGGNLTATLVGDTLDIQTLVISGTGAMADFEEIPWYEEIPRIVRVVINNGVTSIGEHAFSYLTALNRVSIANTVTSIGEFAFAESALESITIPNSVTSINEKTFFYCNNLKEIKVHPNNPVYSSYDGVLFNKNQTKLVYFPSSRYGDYEIPSTVTTIGKSAFYMSALSQIVIPETVSSIEDNAFCETIENLSHIINYSETPPIINSEEIFCVAPVPIVGFSKILYVPAGSKEIYEDSGWNFFTEIKEINYGSLKVKIKPLISDISAYRNMTLNLTSYMRDGIQISNNIVLTDKEEYIFDNIPNGVYNVILYTRFGYPVYFDIVTIESEEYELEIEQPLVSAKVIFFMNETEEIITDIKPTVKWCDPEPEDVLFEGDSIYGVAPGTYFAMKILFDNDFMTRYYLPALGDWEYFFIDFAYENMYDETYYNYVGLDPMQTIVAEGVVTGNNGVLPYATINVSQFLSKSYQKSFTTKADKDGKFSFPLYNDSTVITFSHTGYQNLILAYQDFNSFPSEKVHIDDVSLLPNTGAVITLELTGTESVPDGQKPVADSWKINHSNIDFSMIKTPTGCEISDFVVEYPEIIILDTNTSSCSNIEVGQHVILTLTSLSNEFETVKTELVFDNNLRATAKIDVKQLGSVKATIRSAPAFSAVAIIYDALGKRINQYNYRNGVVNTPLLPDGAYTIVSMAQNNIYNSVMDFSELSTFGLSVDKDYIVNTVTVESGKISEISIASVPDLTNKQNYYSAKTSYKAAKSSVNAEDFQTLRAEIDFLKEYSNEVSDIKFIANIPQNIFVLSDNSVKVGNQTVSNYSYSDNQLTVPLTDLPSIVHFCVSTQTSGAYSLTAYVEFTYNGNTVRRSIGAARFSVTEFTINVPTLAIQPAIIVYGAAPAGAFVNVYDGNQMIGNTQALASGYWSLRCNLYQPTSLSKHSIYAKTTSLAKNLQTEAKTVTHNSEAIAVSKVTMFNTAYPVDSQEAREYSTVFNFQIPAAKGGIYRYSEDLPKFTFTIEFTQNDPEFISNVMLQVFTMSGSVVTIPAFYVPEKQLWITESDFDSFNLPENVNVLFTSKRETIFDSDYMNTITNEMNEFLDKIGQKSDIANTIFEELSKENPNYALIIELMSLNDMNGLYSHNLTDIISELEGLSSTLFNDKVVQALNDAFQLVLEWKTVNTNMKESVEEHSIYGERELTLSNGVKATIVTIPCDGLNENNFQNDEYTAIPTNTGRYIYIKSSASEYILVDFDLNIHQTVTLNPSRMSRMSSEEWTQTISAIDETVELLSEKIENTDYETAIVEYNNKKAQLLENDADLAAMQSVIETKLLTAVEPEITELQNQQSDIEIARYNITMALNVHNKYGDVLNKVPEYLSIVSGIKRAYQDALNNCGKIDELASNIPDTASESEKEALMNDIENIRLECISKFAGCVVTIANFISEDVLASTIELSMLTIQINSGNYELNLVGKSNYSIDNLIKSVQGDIDALYGSLGGNPAPGPCLPATVELNSAGYVYEAVASNRLPDVKVTVYRHEFVEESWWNTVLWDPEESLQTNPHLTNNFGMYALDVPQGTWSVKYEKAGYESKENAYLQVPPPQIEVNVGMIQKSQPYVTDVQGFQSGIEIVFNKYMQSGLMLPSLISVTRNESSVTGNITLLNAEEKPDNPSVTFVSKVRFEPTTPFNINENVKLTIKNVMSYADVKMPNFERMINIQQDINSFNVTDTVKVMLNEQDFIEVAAAPGSAVEGMTIRAQSVSTSVATVSDEDKLDANGKTKIPVHGELPGVTIVNLSVDNTDLKAKAIVLVKTPTAQIIVNNEINDFGNIVVNNESAVKILTITGKYITGTMRYTITGTDASAFSFTGISWNSTTGGALDIIFIPTETRTYTAYLEISAPGLPVKKITLTGTGRTSLTDVPVTGVSLNQTSLTMKVNDPPITLTATVSPTDATNKAVVWTSSDNTVASVNNDGVVTANKVGAATITVETQDGNKTATCTVTVSPQTGNNEVEKPIIAIYPNPSDGRFTIVFAEEGRYNVSVVNSAGQIVSNEIVTGSSAQITLDNQPSGVYILTVDNDKNKATMKILIN